MALKFSLVLPMLEVPGSCGPSSFLRNISMKHLLSNSVFEKEIPFVHWLIVQCKGIAPDMLQATLVCHRKIPRPSAKTPEPNSASGCECGQSAVSFGFASIFSIDIQE